MLITSVYSDVKRGIRDMSVFDVPEDCLVLDLDDFAVKKVFAQSLFEAFINKNNARYIVANEASHHTQLLIRDLLVWCDKTTDTAVCMTRQPTLQYV